MPYVAARQDDPVLQIWWSEHVEQFRWVLTLGHEREVFHGNAKSLEQAMGDIDHCRQIYELRDNLETVH